jgi:hypothetical protein
MRTFTSGSLAPLNSTSQRDSLGTGAGSFKRVLDGVSLGAFGAPKRFFHESLCLVLLITVTSGYEWACA